MKKQKINKKRLLMALQRHNRAGCSDHKLLWRANLFINNGTNDWNNRHTWEFENEWNYDYDVTDYLTDYPHDDQYSGADLSKRYSESFGSLCPGDGDQVVNFTPSTWHGNDFDAGYGYPISDTVIYCWGMTTTPFEFNEHMFDLRDQIASLWSVILVDWETDHPEEESPARWRQLASWSKTIAPSLLNTETTTSESLWINYTGGYSWLPAARKPNSDSFDVAHNTFLLYPFQATENIGIDCGGLVYMSASYEDCPYNIDMQTACRVWLDTGECNSNLNLIVSDEDSYSITVGDNDITTYSNLSLIRPGDIFYYYTGNPFPKNGTGSYHVVIIQDINYPADGRDLIPSDISVIEATGFTRFGGVRNTNTLDSLISNEERTWRIGRLKIGD